METDLEGDLLLETDTSQNAHLHTCTHCHLYLLAHTRTQPFTHTHTATRAHTQRSRTHLDADFFLAAGEGDSGAAHAHTQSTQSQRRTHEPSTHVECSRGRRREGPAPWLATHDAGQREDGTGWRGCRGRISPHGDSNRRARTGAGAGGGGGARGGRAPAARSRTSHGKGSAQNARRGQLFHQGPAFWGLSNRLPQNPRFHARPCRCAAAGPHRLRRRLPAGGVPLKQVHEPGQRHVLRHLAHVQVPCGPGRPRQQPARVRLSLGPVQGRVLQRCDVGYLPAGEWCARGGMGGGMRGRGCARLITASALASAQLCGRGCPRMRFLSSVGSRLWCPHIPGPSEIRSSRADPEVSV